MTKSSIGNLVVSCQRGSKILNVCTELTFEISYLDNEIPNWVSLFDGGTLGGNFSLYRGYLGKFLLKNWNR